MPDLHLGVSPFTVLTLICLKDPKSYAGSDLGPWWVQPCQIGQGVEAS